MNSHKKLTRLSLISALAVSNVILYVPVSTSMPSTKGIGTAVGRAAGRVLNNHINNRQRTGSSSEVYQQGQVVSFSDDSGNTVCGTVSSWTGANYWIDGNDGHQYMKPDRAVIKGCK